MLWGERRRPRPSVRIAVEASPEVLAAVRAAAPDKVKIETAPGSAPVIVVTGPLRQAEKDVVYASLPASQVNAVREAITRYEAENAHHASPAERG